MVVHFNVINKRIKVNGQSFSVTEQALLLKGMDSRRFDGHRMEGSYAQFRRDLEFHLQFEAQQEGTTVDKVIRRMHGKKLIKIIKDFNKKGEHTPGTDSIILTNEGSAAKVAIRKYIEKNKEEYKKNRELLTI